MITPKKRPISHAQKRARERYGIMLDGKTCGEIKRQVTEGEAIKIQTQSADTAIYDVTLDGRVCRIVYNKKKKFIVTVFPDPTVDQTCTVDGCGELIPRGVDPTYTRCPLHAYNLQHVRTD